MKKFLKNEDGLVTIEWVGIAAVMVLAAIAITGFVMQGADSAADGITDGIGDVGDAARDIDTDIGTFGNGSSS